MTRLADWEQRLAAYIELMQLEPFEWGASDCCHFAANAAEHITGAGVGHLYPCNDARSARKRLATHGGVRGIADKHYQTIDISMAQRGDMLCAVVDGEHEGLGICNGLNGWFRAERGLIEIPLTECLAAWRVG